jgi:ferredoxin
MGTEGTGVLMAEKEVSATFDVYRFDPAHDSAPRYDRYTLDLAPHTPVLTALLRIRAEIDPSLTLRYSCRSAICGSCAMQVNSKSRLACETQVGSEIADVVVQQVVRRGAVEQLSHGHSDEELHDRDDVEYRTVAHGAVDQRTVTLPRHRRGRAVSRHEGTLIPTRVPFVGRVARPLQTGSVAVAHRSRARRHVDNVPSAALGTFVVRHVALSRRW